MAFEVAFVWGILFCVAAWRAEWNILGLIAPYLGNAATPWDRNQVASSWFDSVASIAGPINILCASFFGVCAVLLKPGGVRWLMIGLIAFSWPGLVLDRTRHVILLVLLPGCLAFAFLRLRGRMLMQIGFLVAAFVCVEFWFRFVIANRTESSIASAVSPDRIAGTKSRLDGAKHYGFNMLEELCWINYLMDTGDFKPSLGKVFFANLVNPVPRALWPSKPTIGLEYAIARGAVGSEDSGVNVTIASGMVGSGVANFGKWFGPISAAFLMALWCSFMARMDLTGDDFGRLLVYMVGCVSIFNYGRDITLLVAYPAVFGFGLLWMLRRIKPYRNRIADVESPSLGRDVKNKNGRRRLR
ncbi:MAG TPA: hypothetical protein VN673_10735 [Clostridia bacterium]|nr:hypothetical protein [Clostridia bacterium]